MPTVKKNTWGQYSLLIAILVCVAIIGWQSWASPPQADTTPHIKPVPPPALTTEPGESSILRTAVGCLIQVRNGKEPVVDAKILVRDGKMVTIGMSNDLGEFRVSPRDGFVAVEVRHPEFGVVFLFDSLTQDGLEIDFHDEAFFQGRVTLDGESVVEAFPLALAIESQEGKQHFSFSSGMGGLFAVGGFQNFTTSRIFSDLKGVVCNVPESGGMSDFGFPVRPGGLENVEMLSQKFISGQLVELGSQKPISLSEVNLRVSYGGARVGLMDFQGESDEEGKFAILIKRGEIAKIEFDLPGYQVVEKKSLTGDIESGHLGVVQVKAERTLKLSLVSEASGEAISESVFLADGKQLAAHYSNSGGSFLVSCPWAAFSCTVLAEGYLPKEVTVSEDGNDVIEIVLQQCGPYLVQLVSSSSLNFSGFVVSLKNEEGLLPRSGLAMIQSVLLQGSIEEIGFASVNAPKQLGKTMTGEGARVTQLDINVDQTGAAAFQWMRNPSKTTLEVRYSIGEAVYFNTLAWNDSAETMIIEVEIKDRPRAIGGIVLDQNGDPIPGATVMIAGNGESVGRITGATGGFQFKGINGNLLKVRIEKEGYISQRLEGYYFSPDGEDKFHLEKAVPATIHLELPCGAPILVSSVWLQDQSGMKKYGVGVSGVSGDYFFDGCLSGDYTLVFQYGGKKFAHEVSLPTFEHSKPVVEPSLSCLEVSGLGGVGLPSSGTVALRWSTDGGTGRGFPINLSESGAQNRIVHIPTFPGEGTVEIGLLPAGGGGFKLFPIGLQRVIVPTDTKTVTYKLIP